jgi:hypothetical protein
MANWRTGHAVDPVGTVSEANIDTWYASKDRTVEHGWDDAHGYVVQHITSGIPPGHTVKCKVKDNKFWLSISGSTINKVWN